MIWHPLLLSVLAIDVLGLLLVAAATVSAIRIVTGGSPESADAGQASPRQGRREPLPSRGAQVSLFSRSPPFVLIVGITGVLPKIVPGAMCGEGVLQATKGAMGRALALRGLALGVLAVWHLLDRLNRSRPDSPLATQAARTLLLASPVVVLAVYDTFQAILRLDVNRPVDCCTVVYGKIRNVDPAGGSWSIPDAYWIWGLALGGIAIIFVGLHLWRSSRPLGARVTGLVSLVTILWVPVAATALLRSFAAYHYRFPRAPLFVVPLPAGEQARRLPAVRLLDRGCCWRLVRPSSARRSRPSRLPWNQQPEEDPARPDCEWPSPQSSSWLSSESRRSCGDFSSASGSSDKYRGQGSGFRARECSTG